MHGNRVTAYTAVGCLFLLAGAGCVTRKETITIAADRAVTIELQYEGSPQDLAAGDAMPSTEAGWDVTRTINKEEGDEEEHTLRATRVFAPDAALPAGFAAEGDPDADLYLSFPTSLETQRRKDGVYYHFRRVYTPRRWAYVRYWEDIRDDVTEDLADKPVEELTQGERVRIAKAVAGVEAYRHIEFAREAANDAEPELAHDRWLTARRAILNTYEEVDWEGLGDGYMETPEDQRDEYFEEWSEHIRADAHQAMRRSLRVDAGLNHARLARFEQAFDRAKRFYDITNSLGGHHFKITVSMPGRVVAHNADKLDDDGTVFWEFEGDAFRDRPYELLVTSRLQRTSDAD